MKQYIADMGEGPEVMDEHYEVGDIVVADKDWSQLRVVDEVDTAPECMGSAREVRVYHLAGDDWETCYTDWNITLIQDKNEPWRLPA